MRGLEVSDKGTRGENGRLIRCIECSGDYGKFQFDRQTCREREDLVLPPRSWERVQVGQKER